MTGISKSQASAPIGAALQHLKTVQAAWATCNKCTLGEGQYQTVLGTGEVPTQLALVADYPLDGEDKEGTAFSAVNAEPFISAVFGTLGIKKEEVFQTYSLGCRPGDSLNPSQTQMKACKPRLFAELYAADPLIVVSMGQIATSMLLGKWASMDEVLGKLIPIELPGQYGKWQTTLLPTYGLERSIQQAALSDSDESTKTFNHICKAVDALQNYQRLRRTQWQQDCKRPPRGLLLGDDETGDTTV